MENARHLRNPWLAAGVGLLLGFVGRTLSGGTDGDPVASDDHRTAPARNRPATEHSTPHAIGPTIRLLRETADFSADECAEFVREHLENADAGNEFGLEAVFRRWLGRASAEEILGKISEIEGDTTSRTWEPAFFRAWVAMDEGRAMEPARDPFAKARLLFAIEAGYLSFPEYFPEAGPSLSSDDRLGEALTRLARDRPAIARVIADAEISDKSLRTAGIAAVARGWAAADPEAAWSWVGSLGFEEHHEAVAKVLAEWVKTDPQAALAAMDADNVTEVEISRDRELGIITHPDRAQSHLALALALDPFIGPAGLHAQLLEADIDWSESSAFASFVTPAINQSGWYPVDPEMAARQAERLPAGQERDLIMQAIAHNWIAHDRDQALAFAEKHGIESIYLTRLMNAPSAATRQAALAEPERTFAALFDPDIPPIDGLDREQLTDIVKEWARTDPVAASTWLVTQPVDPDELLLDMHFRSAAFDWAFHDPIGAVDWMESLLEAPVKARVWSAIADAVAPYAPDLAFELTAAYAANSSRDHLLNAQLEAIDKSIGRPAAVEMLRSPNLSSEERSALAETLRDAP